MTTFRVSGMNVALVREIMGRLGCAGAGHRPGGCAATVPCGSDAHSTSQNGPNSPARRSATAGYSGRTCVTTNCYRLMWACDRWRLVSRNCGPLSPNRSSRFAVVSRVSIRLTRDSRGLRRVTDLGVRGGEGGCCRVCGAGERVLHPLWETMLGGLPVAAVWAYLTAAVVVSAWSHRRRGYAELRRV